MLCKAQRPRSACAAMLFDIFCYSLINSTVPNIFLSGQLRPDQTTLVQANLGFQFTHSVKDNFYFLT